MTVHNIAQAYTIGYNARVRYGIAAVCPFGRYSSQWRAWYRGWATAGLEVEGRVTG